MILGFSIEQFSTSRWPSKHEISHWARKIPKQNQLRNFFVKINFNQIREIIKFQIDPEC